MFPAYKNAMRFPLLPVSNLSRDGNVRRDHSQFLLFVPATQQKHNAGEEWSFHDANQEPHSHDRSIVVQEALAHGHQTPSTYDQGKVE